MEWKRARKAITAAVLATLLALATAVLEGNAPRDAGGWTSLVMMAVASGLVAGVATYKVRNIGRGINEVGSEDPPSFTTGRSGGYSGTRYAGAAGQDPTAFPRKTTGENPQ